MLSKCCHKLESKWLICYSFCHFQYFSLWGFSGTSGDSLKNLSHLGLAHNKLTRLDRSLLESLTQLDSLTLRGNPWRCDCQLIGFKLWLETYHFKG